jgi:hypothetical protein
VLDERSSVRGPNDLFFTAEPDAVDNVPVNTVTRARVISIPVDVVAVLLLVVGLALRATRRRRATNAGA